MGETPWGQALGWQKQVPWVVVCRLGGGVGSGFADMWHPDTRSHRPERAHRCPWQRVRLPGRDSNRCPRAGDHHWCRELRVEPRVARMSEYTQGGRRAGKRQGLVREGLRDFVEITLPPFLQTLSRGVHPLFFFYLFATGNNSGKQGSKPARAGDFLRLQSRASTWSGASSVQMARLVQGGVLPT